MHATHAQLVKTFRRLRLGILCDLELKAESFENADLTKDNTHLRVTFNFDYVAIVNPDFATRETYKSPSANLTMLATTGIAPREEKKENVKHNKRTATESQGKIM
jgi:hypothetical protein